MADPAHVAADPAASVRRRRGTALVLDFGGPVLVTPFELVGDLGPDAPAYRLLHERGPMAPADRPDEEWRQLQAGALTEREYWDRRAQEWAEQGGGGEAVREMIAHLYDPPRPGMVRHGALELIHDARAAGCRIGVLTNDLRAFHAEEWIEQMHVLDEVDVLVDGSVEGYLKPHRRLYEVMADRLDVGFAEMVFVDDQMTNVRGAQALGIPTVVFDPRDPEAAYAQVRGLLGLVPQEVD
ncbi:MAG TPA: HAD-IA family hydrolase [Nocardioides sp.]|uniref:HAD family hydrolase n=1 Tax=Nocardioides sp. TaxID=35761 RepID=UPI002C495B82|nr:HAD-IA family hydrolase [Nocardioides sp.]HQR27893.1 HAD-IA family hydrolase [Nocardioides sp.]